ARSRRLPRLGPALLIACGALGLVTWFGFRAVEARLATLWQGDALQEDRLGMWTRTLPLVKDFPVWGTGLGTFPYVAPLGRGPAADATLFYQHAHNEYLQALVEGGLARLALSVAAVALVFGLGGRAFRHYQDRPAAGLVLGALFGLATVVVHSFVDFGL